MVHCCHVEADGTQCSRPATKEIFVPGEPDSTLSCDEHLPEFLSEGATVFVFREPEHLACFFKETP